MARGSSTVHGGHQARDFMFLILVTAAWKRPACGEKYKNRNRFFFEVASTEEKLLVVFSKMYAAAANVLSDKQSCTTYFLIGIGPATPAGPRPIIDSLLGAIHAALLHQGHP